MINKERIKNAYIGDFHWLEIILEEVESNKKELKNYEDIINLLNVLFKMNYIVIETETEIYAEKYYTEIHEVYSKMKVDLTEMLDYKEMWEELL